jgi:hypothetical protein
VRFCPSSEGLRVVERKKKIIGFNLDSSQVPSTKALKPADATERETNPPNFMEIATNSIA